MERRARSCAGFHFLAGFRGGHLSAEKRSAFAKRLASFRNQMGDKLPGMGNDGPNFQVDEDAGGAGAFGEARGVIAQHLVCANVDEKRWQASEISVERGREWIAGIGVTEIVARRVGNACTMKHGAAVVVGANGLASDDDVLRRISRAQSRTVKSNSVFYGSGKAILGRKTVVRGKNVEPVERKESGDGPVRLR